MFASLLTLCMSAVFAAPSLDQKLDDHWHLWKNYHGKNYHEVGSILELVARHQLQHKGNAMHVFIHKFYFAMAEISASSERRGLEENGVGEELQKN